MRRLMMWSAIAGFTACLIRPTLVSVTPEYGYVDGCTEVLISGHDLGVAAKAKLKGKGGEVDIELSPAEPDPKKPEWAQDVGFDYTATMPPSPAAEGFYDLILTVDGEELEISQGWYYRTCPGGFRVDHYQIPYEGAGTQTVTAGGTIAFQGCGLTTDVVLEFLRGTDGTGTVAATASAVEDCSTAAIHFVIPALEPGQDHTMQLVFPDGTVMPLSDSCFTESGDTAGCLDLAVINGGAR
jgi:hypothetical protein